MQVSGKTENQHWMPVTFDPSGSAALKNWHDCIKHIATSEDRPVDRPKLSERIDSWLIADMNTCIEYWNE